MHAGRGRPTLPALKKGLLDPVDARPHVEEAFDVGAGEQKRRLVHLMTPGQ